MEVGGRGVGVGGVGVWVGRGVEVGVWVSVGVDVDVGDGAWVWVTDGTGVWVVLAVGDGEGKGTGVVGGSGVGVVERVATGLAAHAISGGSRMKSTNILPANIKYPVPKLRSVVNCIRIVVKFKPSNAYSRPVLPPHPSQDAADLPQGAVSLHCGDEERHQRLACGERSRTIGGTGGCLNVG